MKKIIAFSMSGILLLGSCGSYAGMGAYTGAQLGSILGAAIGGISGGARGSNWGEIIGMAGGTVIGTAISTAVEEGQRRKIEGYHERMEQREANRQRACGNPNGQPQDGQEVFDPTNSGDDRIDFENGGNVPLPENNISEAIAGNDASAMEKEVAPQEAIEISHIKYIDGNGDDALGRGEKSKIVFELRNRSRQAIRNVQPIVQELSGNKHVYVSPSISIESIAPGSGIKYTAAVVADRKIKTGILKFRISALQDNSQSSKTAELLVNVRR
ncbi:MAG: hypothetical protein PUH24_04295 [Prevotellaceae bacterium]|nr:hypothetical protein [Prevotellaceae bacterium]MDY6131625.1 hypothetical protein [Prevotella sp.]